MKLICVTGPTASGKTALSIALAKRLGGEIVSCDSMQLYRGMDIGTAKPDESEREGIPHHMLDVANPSETYSAARYSEEASRCVDDIVSRGKTTIVVGGTGLYLDALLGNISFETEPTDEETRMFYQSFAEKYGGGALHSLLLAVDPESAGKIHLNDIKRTIRALEVYKKTGKTMSRYISEAKRRPPRYESVILALCPEDRQALYDRIDARVDVMRSMGLEQEARELYMREDLSPTALQAIGYKELFSHFRGEISLGQAFEDIKLASRRYAKRQLTWFRCRENINWILYGKDVNFSLILEKAGEYLASCDIII